MKNSDFQNLVVWTLIFVVLVGGLVILKRLYPEPYTQQEASQKEEKNFNFDNFIGQRVIITHIYPSKIKNLHLNIIAPEGYKIFYEAHPSIKLLAEDGRLIKKYVIRRLSSSYFLNLQVDASKLYVHLALYYCKEGNQGLCLVQNVLYEIPIDLAQKSSGDLNLEYNILKE